MGSCKKCTALQQQPPPSRQQQRRRGEGPPNIMQHESGHSLPIVFLTLAAIRAINFHRRLAILIKRLCTCLYAEARERFLATIDSHFLWIDETTRRWLWLWLLLKSCCWLAGLLLVMCLSTSIYYIRSAWIHQSRTRRRRTAEHEMTAGIQISSQHQRRRVLGGGQMNWLEKND